MGLAIEIEVAPVSFASLRVVGILQRPPWKNEQGDLEDSEGRWRLAVQVVIAVGGMPDFGRRRWRRKGLDSTEWNRVRSAVCEPYKAAAQ